MDDETIADLLGMRRKFAFITEQNDENENLIQQLQDQVDDLQGHIRMAD